MGGSFCNSRLEGNRSRGIDTMTETVYVELLSELNPKIRSQLVRLNNRWNGRMLKHLKNPSEYVRNATVYYILVDDRVASWGMTYHPYEYRYTKKGMYSDRKYKSQSIQADVYTKKAERGQGFGYRITRVMCECIGKTMRAAVNNSTIFKDGFKSH